MGEIGGAFIFAFASLMDIGLAVTSVGQRILSGLSAMTGQSNLTIEVAALILGLALSLAYEAGC